MKSMYNGTGIHGIGIQRNSDVMSEKSTCTENPRI